MNRRSVFKWLATVVLLIIVGAVVGAGIVYAATSISARTANVSVTRSEISAAAQDSEQGVLISKVDPDGPAAQSGVVRGDILLAIDGEEVDSALVLRRRLSDFESDDEIQLTVQHGDEQRTLNVALGERNGRPYLGVTPCQDVFFDLPDVEAILPDASGATIVRVLPDTPAEDAGLQEGDRIVSVDDQELDPDHHLADLIAAYQPGDTVTLAVERLEEDAFEVTVDLAAHPDDESVAYLGVEFRPTPRLRLFQGDGRPFGELFRHFERPSLPMPLWGDLESGVIIHRVTEDSPAAEAGLSEGDVVTAVDGEPVAEPSDLVDAIAAREPGDQITLSVLGPDDEQEREVEITLGQHPDQEDQAYLGVFIGGFVRSERFEEGDAPSWMPRLGELFDRFHFRHGDDGLEWQPGEGLRGLPFQFDLPPERFDELPCCSGDVTA